MPAPAGNNYNEYPIEEIKILIGRFALHIGEGYSKESFVECDYRTIESHLEKYPEELQAEKREVEKAYRQCRQTWETHGIKLVKGGYEGGSTTAYIFNMKNRFPDEWREKQEIEQSGNLSINWNEQKTYNTK